MTLLRRGANAISYLGPVAGIFGRGFQYDKAGDYLSGHTHQCDHAVLVMRGRVEIHRDGAPEEVLAGAMVGMPAQAQHTIVALDDDSVTLCLFVIPEGATDIRPYTE